RHQPHRQGNAGAIEEARKNVPPELVRTHPMPPGRGQKMVTQILLDGIERGDPLGGEGRKNKREDKDGPPKDEGMLLIKALNHNGSSDRPRTGPDRPGDCPGWS